MNKNKIVSSDIKKINKSSIYHEFLHNKNLTKQNLVTKLDICLPTVTNNINALLKEKLIEKSGTTASTGGRKAVTYSLVENSRIALGIDISYSHITIVALNLAGTIIASRREKTAYENSDSYYKKLSSLLDEVVKEIKVPKSHILGVGIGIPALVDNDNRHVFFSKIIDLGKDPAKTFSKYIPYKIRLFNDANAAAFTETWQNHEMKNMFYLMLSNNIGGAMILDGKVYIGDNQRSAEIGHIPIEPGGRQCYCGKKGCIDRYLASSLLSDKAGGDLSAFFEKLDKGDSDAVKAWDEYTDYLARTVNIAHILLDCTVVLGGYVGEYAHKYIEDIKEKTYPLNPFTDDLDYIALCSYKKESIAAGSALYFIDKFIKSV